MKYVCINKKIIFLILAVALMFCSCTAKVYTPVINTEFEYNAVCKIGDFSYNCKVLKTESELSVIPTTTYASGMKMTYDGKKLTFSKNNISESYEKDLINYPNPAKLMYEAFTACEDTDNITVQKLKEGYAYVGKISVGNFKLLQNEDNTYKSLTIENSNITIIFKQ